MLTEKKISKISVREDGTRHQGCDESSGWVWYAARALEKHLLEMQCDNKFVLDKLRILELGSGTGWLSLLLAEQGAIVTATDRTGALPLLLRNVMRNQELHPDVDEDGESTLQVDVQQLHWDKQEERIEGEWDLFVGSDVLYLQETYGPLLQTLIRHNCRLCILAWEERKPQEEATFFELARAAGFQFDSPSLQIAINPTTLKPVWCIHLTYCGNTTASAIMRPL